MKKPKLSVQDIAEILVDKIDSFEQITQRIERASQQELKVDSSEMKKLYLAQVELQKQTTAQIKQVLGDLKNFKEKQKAKLPNWILAVLFGFFVLFLASTVYFYKTHQDYTQQKSRADYYENEYYKLKKK